jgi:hypothetical protein
MSLLLSKLEQVPVVEIEREMAITSFAGCLVPELQITTTVLGKNSRAELRTELSNFFSPAMQTFFKVSILQSSSASC